MGMGMSIEMWVGVVAMVVIPGVVLVAARSVARHAPQIAHSSAAGRARRTTDVCLTELGPKLSALLFVLAGLSITLITSWILGKGAHAIQGGVDWPVWRWFGSHQNTGWTNAWWHITNMGSPMVTQDLAVLGAVVMAIGWRKRVWWLPPAALFLGYVCEKYGQIILKSVVDRGHPPHAAEKFGAVAQTFGTWPSGGCARVLVIYGLITYFAVRGYRNGASSRAWVIGASFVSLALTVQAYARLNNMEHWITDVIGGAIYGVMLLAVMITGAEIVQRGRSRTRVSVSPDSFSSDRSVTPSLVGSASVHRSALGAD